MPGGPCVSAAIGAGAAAPLSATGAEDGGFAITPVGVCDATGIQSITCPSAVRVLATAAGCGPRSFPWGAHGSDPGERVWLSDTSRCVAQVETRPIIASEIQGANHMLLLIDKVTNTGSSIDRVCGRGAAPIVRSRQRRGGARSSLA